MCQKPAKWKPTSKHEHTGKENVRPQRETSVPHGWPSSSIGHRQQNFHEELYFQNVQDVYHPLRTIKYELRNFVFHFIAYTHWNAWLSIVIVSGGCEKKLALASCSYCTMLMKRRTHAFSWGSSANVIQAKQYKIRRFTSKRKSSYSNGTIFNPCLGHPALRSKCVYPSA